MVVTVNVIDRVLCGALYVVAVALVVGGFVGAVASSWSGYSIVLSAVLFVTSALCGLMVFAMARAGTQFYNQTHPKEQP